MHKIPKIANKIIINETCYNYTPVITATKARCQDGFVRWRNSCYKFEGNHKYTWAEAKTICQALGGDLVTIETSYENYWVKSYARAKGIVILDTF